MEDCSEDIEDERMLRPNGSEAEADMVGLPAAKDDPLSDDMAGNLGWSRWVTGSAWMAGGYYSEWAGRRACTFLQKSTVVELKMRKPRQCYSQDA